MNMRKGIDMKRRKENPDVVMKCPWLSCGHEWHPRVPDPRACPKCKRYLIVYYNSKNFNSNIECPLKFCISNVKGYCHGNISLIVDNFEYETRDDGHMVHEALQCENYIMKA